MCKNHWYYMTTKNWYEQIKLLHAYSDRDAEVWWQHSIGSLLRIHVRPDKIFEMQQLGWEMLVDV